MSLEYANFTLDEPAEIEMRTLLGESVVVIVSAIDTRPERVELSGSVSWDTWQRVAEVGAFHLDLDPNYLDGAGDADVEVVLVMRSGLVEMLNDTQELIDGLFGEPDVLHQTEAWLLGSAMQSVEVVDAPGATASVGFRTEWARPLLD